MQVRGKSDMGKKTSSTSLVGGGRKARRLPFGPVAAGGRGTTATRITHTVTIPKRCYAIQERHSIVRSRKKKKKRVKENLSRDE